MSILNVTDRERELEAQISKLNKDLAFVERWASHHGAKSCHSAESILGVIQHYPSIKAITNGYVDGVVPDTYDPYAEIAELKLKVAELESRCKWPLCQTPEFQDALANEVASEIFGDVQCMQDVADRYAHRLALELECVLADRPGYYDKAMQVLCEYRRAMNAIHERESPTFMGEPLLPEHPCSDHPDAPHGFNRNASHAAGRAVCECEGWTP